jgi:hypothetical protein
VCSFVGRSVSAGFRSPVVSESESSPWSSELPFLLNEFFGLQIANETDGTASRDRLI